ncbi:hypothetical protein QA649_03125 [Bradyrhizobium sp. CB1717]|uniref:hypothetical protein n=1 Tax=Bradyrhizobium sp. CB1717 TaxID=3039154 RepID=UPI0024B14A43|nr:hypothetical protein [Bradyrhizobium sp. CB1717]WFU29124.1 hypothetical protein QA649_03125 [Bradyrhizobium sp. CB1717]
MGSFGLPRATRFETTTKFTGRPLLFIPPRLTAVHQYGSCHDFFGLKPKSGMRVGAGFACGTRNFTAKTAFATLLRACITPRNDAVPMALCL